MKYSAIIAIPLPRLTLQLYLTRSPAVHAGSVSMVNFAPLGERWGKNVENGAFHHTYDTSFVQIASDVH